MKKFIFIVCFVLVGCGGGTTGPLVKRDDVNVGSDNNIPLIEIPTATELDENLASLHATKNSLFDTTEYRRSGALSAINASSAYERGYTGKNSIIAILDTGIDTKNPEFANKILQLKDFSGSTTAVDRHGHGTHVAGIAAASKNDVGVHGVAYDAKLLIGKISDNGAIYTDRVLNAIAWANQNRADVINLSSGWSLTQTYLNAQKLNDGTYKTKFTNTNDFPLSNYININDWVNASKGDSVIVISAGNDRKPWSQGLAILATAVDSNNKLLLDGRVIIAGNYNTATQTLERFSNGAAHLCQQLDSKNNCLDKFKTYDFYLMAPGTRIVSTYPESTPGYVHPIDPVTRKPATLVPMTGTSMAAPVISGAVAIIREMWPQMTSNNIARLLLSTANKNIPNYNLYVHGQGLLDLEKATRPYGTLGIPTNGRLNSQTTSVQPLLYTSGSASTGGLSSVMLIDEFTRDFYIEGKYFTGYQQKEHNVQQTLYMYSNKNPYTLFNNYDKRIVTNFNNFSLEQLFDNKNFMFQLGYNKSISNIDFKFTYGFFNESKTWLGNSVGGFYGTTHNRPSFTNTIGINLKKNVDNFSLYGNYNFGLTQTDSSSSNVLSIKNIVSNAFTIGAEYSIGKNVFGLLHYKPVTVSSAKADLSVPVGLDNEFNIINNVSINFAPTVKENRFGLYYNFKMDNQQNLNIYIERRNNYLGQEGVKDTVFGLHMTKYF